MNTTTTTTNTKHKHRHTTINTTQHTQTTQREVTNWRERERAAHDARVRERDREKKKDGTIDDNAVSASLGSTPAHEAVANHSSPRSQGTPTRRRKGAAKLRVLAPQVPPSATRVTTRPKVAPNAAVVTYTRHVRQAHTKFNH